MKTTLVMILLCSCLSSNAQTKGDSMSGKKSDTMKMELPKSNNFDPSNPKLKNSKIKTPVYNNQLTGTNAPGDRNTGIPASTSNDRKTVNVSQERVKVIQDSLSGRRPNR